MALQFKKCASFSRKVYSSVVFSYCKVADEFHSSSRLFGDIGKPSDGIERPSSILKGNTNEESIKELLDDAACTAPEVSEDPQDIWSTSPYPAGSRHQGSHALRPRVDPRETSIIMFPGQGNQHVGMGQDLLKFPVVRDLFDTASEILGYNLQKLCTDGPLEQLNKTVHCQLATFVCSMAALERLKEERLGAIENCIATAGFSVGEFAALTFAGVFSFERAVRLVKIRAEAMQLASEMAEGGMITVLYAPDSKLNYACKCARQFAQEQGVENPVCSISNYLFPHCKIVAGHEEALQYIEKNAVQFNLKRTKRLAVSGAFHSELMQPAVEPFRAALRKADLCDPLIAVHSNLDGKRYGNAEHIRRSLPRQIVAPVKWEQTLHVLYERPQGENFPNTFECGPGRSLKAILRMVNAKAADVCYNF